MLCHLESKQGGRLIGECISRKRKSTKIDWKFKHTQHYVSRVWLTILHIGWLNLELALALTRDMCHHISCFFVVAMMWNHKRYIFVYKSLSKHYRRYIYIYSLSTLHIVVRCIYRVCICIYVLYYVGVIWFWNDVASSDIIVRHTIQMN